MNRVLPAVVMIVIVGIFTVVNVVTHVPFVLVLVILVAGLCWVELCSIDRQPMLGRDAKSCISNQYGIIMLGGMAVVANLVLLPGSSTITMPWFGLMPIPDNVTVILLIMISSIIFENTVAWAVGKAWSGLKRRLGLRPPRPAFPRYSPSKTVVGSAAGIVGGIGLGVWLVQSLSAETSQEFHVLLLVLACMTPPLSEWGDWVESRMKRKCRVKDSNSLITESDDGKLFSNLTKSMGGHGGFVDRTDAMFFCLAWSLLPVTIYAFWLIAAH